MNDRIRHDIRFNGVANTRKYQYFVGWNDKLNAYAVYRAERRSLGTTGFAPKMIATLEEVLGK